MNIAQIHMKKTTLQIGHQEDYPQIRLSKTETVQLEGAAPGKKLLNSDI